MSGAYFSKHSKPWRDVIETAIEEIDPYKITISDYTNQLLHFDRHDEERFHKPPRIFATCVCCGGTGQERNAKWVDEDEDPYEPEVIDCTMCSGAGLVELIDELPTAVAAPNSDEDLPF